MTIAYWKLKECEGLLTAENKSSEQFGIIFNMAKLKYDKGTISRLEKDRAETALIDSYIDLIRAETEKEKALDTLLKEMGIENKQDYSICLSDEPEKEVTPLPYKLEKYIETALSKRPEILQVKKEILAKESDLRAVKSEYYPHVDLIGNYSWIGYDHSDLEGAWEDIQGDSWSIFMVLKYNLFQGFSTKNKTRKAQLSLSAEKSEFEGCSKSIILEVKNAYNEVIGKGREIEKARKTILLAENNLAAAMKQWELGVVTIEKVAEDNISLAKTRKRYINILIDLEIAKAKLKWATGEEIQ